MSGFLIFAVYRYKSLFFWERFPDKANTLQAVQERIHGMLPVAGNKAAFDEWISTQRDTLDGILHDARNTRRRPMGPNVSCLNLVSI